VTLPGAAAIAACVLAVLAAEGCGGGQISPDLFAVQRSGSVPGAALQMVVNDGGTVTCNGGGARPVSDPLLLQARAVTRDLHDPATRGLALPPGPQPVLRYAARTQDGHVSFSDDSAAQPAVLYRLALLVRQIAQQDCGLAR
jgi:hypothetical protein